MAKITINDVKAQIPVTNDGALSDSLLNVYINLVTTVADEDLFNIFPETDFTVVTEADCINYGTQNTFGTNFVSIRAWQDELLTIKLIDVTKASETTLTEPILEIGKHYRLWYGKNGSKIPGLALPVTHIELFGGLGSSQLLRVAGKYGWQVGYPEDVKNALISIIVDVANYANNFANTANSGSNEAIIRIKSLSTEKQADVQLLTMLRDQTKNFMNNPLYLFILSKYRSLTTQGFTVL